MFLIQVLFLLQGQWFYQHLRLLIINERNRWLFFLLKFHQVLQWFIFHYENQVSLLLHQGGKYLPFWVKLLQSKSFTFHPQIVLNQDLQHECCIHLSFPWFYHGCDTSYKFLRSLRMQRLGFRIKDWKEWSRWKGYHFKERLKFIIKAITK